MTDIEICNLALGLVGKASIATLDDESPAARLCKALYAPLRDAVLEDAIWTFAKKQYVLDPLATAPLFGYTYAFEVPGEVVRVFRCDDGTGDYRIGWEKLGRQIISDAAPLYMSAVAKVEDVSLYSANFCIAVATRLAFKAAVPLTENRQLKADLWQEYQTELKNAAGTDGSQGKNERIRSDSLSRARLTGYREP